VKENIESSCWDCPNRRGLSRVIGSAACKFWNNIDNDQQHVTEQRGECAGPVPVRLISSSKTSFDIEGTTVIHKRNWRDTYLTACSKDFDTPPESPDVVKIAMRDNHLGVYTHERVEIKTQTLEEYKNHRAIRPFPPETNVIFLDQL